MELVAAASIIVAYEDVLGGLDRDRIISALMDEVKCELRLTGRTAMIFRMSQCGHVESAGPQIAGESFTVAGTRRDNGTASLGEVSLGWRHGQGRPVSTKSAVVVIRTVSANRTMNVGEAIGARMVSARGTLGVVETIGAGWAI